MYQKMRLKNRSMDQEEAMSVLNHGEYGILSTADQDNQPYGVPLNYTVIENNIFFHCATKGHKILNILSNPKVSFCVVGDSKIIPEKFTSHYKSVIVFGSASVAVDEEKKEGLRELIRKYSPDYLKSGEDYIAKLLDKTTVVKISMDHITGKANDNE